MADPNDRTARSVACDAGRVLLVHEDARRRQPMAAAITGLGFEVVEASTPVEAIWELENGPMDFQAALVARALGPSDGRDIVRFISLRYPGVTRVLFGGGHSAHIDAHIDPAQVHAILADALATPGLRKLFDDG